MRRLRIALCQINTTVGDFEGNTEKIIEHIKKAQSKNADIAVFPELSITGYSPKDILFRDDFIERNLICLKRIVSATNKISVIIGFVSRSKKCIDDRHIHNSAAVIYNRKMIGVYHKKCLPNHDVLNELRYFVPGEESPVFELKGTKVGVNICWDIWKGTVPREQAGKGAEILINISASPFFAGRDVLREKMLSQRATETKCPIVYLNLAGAQDDIIYDGRSYIFSASGIKLAEAKPFEEDFLVYDLNLKETSEKNRKIKESEINKSEKTKTDDEIIEDTYHALVLGVREYFRKNSHKSAFLGLSGGMDSAVTLAVAVDALGRENVTAVFMPTRYTAGQSRADARYVANALNVKLIEIPIEEIFIDSLKTLKPVFRDKGEDETEENIQARLRCMILMALANKFRGLVLATGNKSEIATGYCTLYGDLAGGLAVLSDVYKTGVYKLAKFINRKFGKAVIPGSIFKRVPTAELKPNQRDEDRLPPYKILDPILKMYIEENKSREEIIKKGFDRKTVEYVLSMVKNAEHKRRQMPIGLRVSKKAFGSGWVYPVTRR